MSDMLFEDESFDISSVFIDDGTQSPSTKPHIHLLFTGNPSEYDLPSIIEQLEKNIQAKLYGKDAISMFNLAHDINAFEAINWDDYPCSVRQKHVIQQDLAKAFVFAVKEFNPDKYAYEIKRSELGEGEAIDRHISHYASLLNYNDGVAWDLANQMANSLAEEITNPDDRQEYEDYVESVYHQAMKDSLESEVEDISPEWREILRKRMYEEENINPKTKFKDLPWYFSEMLKHAGVGPTEDEDGESCAFDSFS